ncbi:MAG: hypothetical protein ACFFCW_32585 [Candidatus Hodarchaeota archaeon]
MSEREEEVLCPFTKPPFKSCTCDARDLIEEFDRLEKQRVRYIRARRTLVPSTDEEAQEWLVGNDMIIEITERRVAILKQAAQSCRHLNPFRRFINRFT